MADQVAAHVLADHDASQGLCTLTLNRPGKSNALNAELVDALLQALERCSLDNTRVLVVTGAGKNFCGGFDFTDYERQSEGDLLQRFVRIELLLQRLRRAPFVTIAAVSGAAFGAGADIAAACTFRLARPQSRFRFPGFRFGVALGSAFRPARGQDARRGGGRADRPGHACARGIGPDRVHRNYARRPRIARRTGGGGHPASHRREYG